MDQSLQDCYFVITKRPELLGHPTSLQRWLDYLGAQVRRASTVDAARGMHPLVQLRRCILAFGCTI